MFKKLSEATKKEVNIYSPLNGEVIELSEIPDEVFSKKLMGDGFAIIPKDGMVYSPVEGRVFRVFSIGHAIVIETIEGLKILIHIGLETVGLNGEGFEVIAKEGDLVSVGDLLLVFDLNFIEDHNKEIITPIVVTNYKSKIKNISKMCNIEVSKKDLVLKCELI